MKLWFSILSNEDYKGSEPSFYLVEEFVWAKKILESKQTIINEFNLAKKSYNVFRPYFNKEFTLKESSWKVLSLKFWSVNFYENQKIFPKTTEILNDIPNVLSFSFSLLEPGEEINTHCGDTNAIYRCHLGIDIPETLPSCGFQVNTEKRSWGESDLLIFCDALPHKAWNKTDNVRIILIIDVLRDDFKDQKKNILSMVVSGILLQMFKIKTSRSVFKFFKPLSLFLILIFNKVKILQFVLKRI